MGRRSRGFIFPDPSTIFEAPRYPPDIGIHEVMEARTAKPLPIPSAAEILALTGLAWVCSVVLQVLVG